MRLAETELPISFIAQEVGLSNLANFNRQFRRLREMTPKQYRESFRRNGALPDAPRRDDLSQRPPSLEKTRRRRVGFREGEPSAAPQGHRASTAQRMR
jgi:hypothetical protein